MTQDGEPDDSFSQEQLHDKAVRYLLAMLRSASTDEIAPKDWWRRGRAALEWGAKVGTTFHEMTSEIADSLQIEAPTKATSKEVSSIYSDLTEANQVDVFQRVCRRQSTAIVIDAQVVREMERDEYEEQDSDEVEFADPFGLASEMDLPTQSEE